MATLLMYSAAFAFLRATVLPFAYSFSRYRIIVDQWILRGCWTGIAIMFLLASQLKPEAIELENVDTSALVFLLFCSGILELTSLSLYKARLDQTPNGLYTLVCRHSWLGEVRLTGHDIQLILTTQSGPEGFSHYSTLGFSRKGRANKPSYLVDQVVLRLKGRVMVKYLVICETRSKSYARRLAVDLGEKLGVPVVSKDQRPPAPKKQELIAMGLLVSDPDNDSGEFNTRESDLSDAINAEILAEFGSDSDEDFSEDFDASDSSQEANAENKVESPLSLLTSPTPAAPSNNEKELATPQPEKTAKDDQDPAA